MTNIVETYITFGVQYKENPDPRYLDEAHPRGMYGTGYAVIEAPSRDVARDIAFAIFGQQWAFDYDTPPNEEHAPAGEILRIAWLDRDALSQARGAIEEAEASEHSDGFDDVFDARDALADVVRSIIKGARQ
ncbi:MAG: Microbacterium phage OneinaGillian [Actinomycetota bacterium]|jgi:hypothetical protein